MSKREKIERMISISEPEFTQDLAEALKMSETQRHKKEIKDAVHGIYQGIKGIKESEKSTRVKRSIREVLLIPINLDLSEDIEDKGLREAVRIIQKRIIGNSQKDTLVRSLARGLYSDWGKMTPQDFDALVGSEGSLTMAKARVDAWDDLDALAADITSASKLLGVYFWDRFSEAELDSFIADAKKVVDGLMAGTDVFQTMGDCARLFLESGQILKSMRSAFSGLLVGDLILSAVGPAVGLKQGASIIDAIIDIGVKVAQKEHLAQVEKERLQNFRQKLDSI